MCIRDRIRDDWTRFSLRKTDTGGRALAGVQFALVDADGNQIMTAETDENGLASFERIPHGRYSVVAVSYTHLDVYKRQAARSGDTGRRNGGAAGNRAGTGGNAG